MKRLAVLAVLASALSLLSAAETRAAPLPCGLPVTRPLWVDFSDSSVSFRLELFAKPGLVLASNGIGGPAELRARGAHTLFWLMKFQSFVGTPAAPADPAGIPAAVDELHRRAVQSTGCQTPLIALNELFGSRAATPWTPSMATYKANVLNFVKGLAAKGDVPFLLVPGRPRAPFVDGEARSWWLEIARYGHIVRQMHFEAPYVYRLGRIEGPRARRSAMRRALDHLIEIGVPAERLGLLLGFQSGIGLGGRNGLQPSAAWLEIVKQETLAARQVAGEYGITSIWSWGWGTFDEAGADADKPRAACIYLWVRDPTLCNGPAAAGPGFFASLTVGQINLPEGVQCATPVGRIRADAVAALEEPLSTRRNALTVLLSRLLFQAEGVEPSAADVDAAFANVAARAFDGDTAAFDGALDQAGLRRAVARQLVADQLRRQAFLAVVQIRHGTGDPNGLLVRRQHAALARTICLRDELPGTGSADPAGWLPFLAVRPARVTIEAARNRIERGAPVTLGGVVQSDRAGERVTVYARTAGGYAPVTSVRTAADGRWSVRIRPQVNTTYRALSKSAVSSSVVVRVRR